MYDCLRIQHPLLNITYTFHDLSQQSAHMGVPLYCAQKCVLSNTALCGVSCQSVYEDTSSWLDGQELLQQYSWPYVIQIPATIDCTFIASNNTGYTVFYKQILQAKSFYILKLRYHASYSQLIYIVGTHDVRLRCKRVYLQILRGCMHRSDYFHYFQTLVSENFLIGLYIHWFFLVLAYYLQYSQRTTQTTIIHATNQVIGGGKNTYSYQELYPYFLKDVTDLKGPFRFV